ncbi:cilia- and flagella-associated protein 95 isoform X1 [Rhineura floridana]|uniref:cilia- and flagella-associated protein 95 isoform X1 n=1 Tax=Rhineura floridana TaxID=261503 RepID=UPI002AC80EDF|nr:cilia- and flagella-associated protein 95 isoform X1 [Rhineura floridana]XP_061484282.1 cilia- and flagella-associated protein 95 isoform X1 [Rhineura floridana]
MGHYRWTTPAVLTAAWTRKDQRAQAFIILALSDSQLMCVRDEPSAKQMWDTLQDLSQEWQRRQEAQRAELMEAVRSKEEKSAEPEEAAESKQDYKQQLLKACYACGARGHLQKDCAIKQNSRDGGLKHGSVNFVCKQKSQDLGPIDWLVDSGASHILIKDRSLFYASEEVQDFVQLADGSQKRVEARGLVRFNKLGIMSECLFVPELAHNILSVQKLVDSGYCVTFDRGKCFVQRTGKVVCQGFMTQGQFRMTVGVKCADALSLMGRKENDGQSCKKTAVKSTQPQYSCNAVRLMPERVHRSRVYKPQGKRRGKCAPRAQENAYFRVWCPETQAQTFKPDLDINLESTETKSLVLSGAKTGGLECFVDADHPGELSSRKSTSGIVVMWHGSCIDWSSKRTKHISVRYFHVRDCVQQEFVNLTFCDTDNMVADIMTKPLCEEKFGKLVTRLGMSQSLIE